MGVNCEALLSLLEKNNHIVIDVEANVAIRLVLHRKTASQNDQTVPSLSELVIKFGLDVFRDVGVVRGAKTLQALDHRDDRGLSHFSIHVVSLDPNFSVCCRTVDLECITVVTGNNNCFSSIGAFDAESLNLRGYNFNHLNF